MYKKVTNLEETRLEQINITIPQNAENMKLPDPSLLNYYKNIERRVLWVDGEIDVCCLEYVRYIIEWNRIDRENNVPIKERIPIKLMIFSGGGDLGVTNSLIDVIELSDTPVYGYNINTAFSGACYIYMKCHKKFALKKSSFLIHTGSGDGFSGTYEQILAAVQEYQRQIEELAQFILENSKISEDVLSEHLGTEWYLSAQEALKLGMCDEILGNMDLLLM
jgi:ATP-dependent protease ClpP protease subunit